MLPAADGMEKEGSIVTSGRLIQWRPKVAAAAGEALADHDILHLMALKLKELYQADPGPFPDPILDLTWDYGGGPTHPVVGELMDINKVAREINGFAVEDLLDDKGAVLAKKGDMLSTFARLTADGKTACGCWVFTGYYAPASDGEGQHHAGQQAARAKRIPAGWASIPTGALPGRSTAASSTTAARPTPTASRGREGKELIWWDADRRLGHQRRRRQADPGQVGGQRRARLCRHQGARRPPAADDPFIMRTDGKGGLFAAMNEGPLPAHYEPVESPTTNPAIPNRPVNPIIKVWKTNEGQSVGDNWGTPTSSPSSPPPIAWSSTGRRAACPAGWSGWPRLSPTCSWR